MFALWKNRRKASESLYRNAFAILTFVALIIALTTHSPIAFFAVLIFGALSRTAARKEWRNPWFSKYVPWLYRKPQEAQEIQEKAQENNSDES